MRFRKPFQGFILASISCFPALSLDLNVRLANLQSYKKQSRSHEHANCSGCNRLRVGRIPRFFTHSKYRRITAGRRSCYCAPEDRRGNRQGEAAMKSRAAVAIEKGKPLEIMDVELEGPKAGEVMVEVKATGICHTDEFTLSGADPEGLFPAIL